jgi:cysteinyl-tRNA synthetase
MALEVYNTLTQRKEEFMPSGETVRMYICGPTVYDYAHLGHARSYVFFDIVRRYLDFKGFKVRHVQNFTDVEDSITKRAKAEGRAPLEVADHYIKEFLADMNKLRVRRAHEYPRVSEYIPEMVKVVEELVAKGFAYVHDGEVFLRARKAGGLGCLTHRDPSTMVIEGAPASGREDPLDFALWRRSKPGEPSWPSPWGPGRPGWHIECYAMASHLLGPQLDIHGGGVDLQFPHHEGECSVSKALTGLPFSRYWLHNNFITIRGSKMSKSLGNFVTLRNALKDYDFEVLRFFLLGAHYRQPIDYSEEGLRRARDEHTEISDAIGKLHRSKESGSNGGALAALADDVRRRFFEAMDDDFNTPTATDAVLQLARAVNGAKALGRDVAERLLLDLCDFCSVLGLCEEELQGEAGGSAEPRAAAER